jgi:predicted DNA-binding protein with PD1-like motif
MKFTEARMGRIFVLRLEDGELVQKTIEQFAVDQHIGAASVLIIGGADDGSALVAGPGKDRGLPVEPMKIHLENVHEISGVGTIFKDEEGVPLLHLHMACGRAASTVTGCVRDGMKVWHVMEVIITELADCTAQRAIEEPLGLKLLRP